MSVRHRLFVLILLAPSSVRADGPGDNAQDRVRPIPPPGITLKDSDRAELQAGVDRLGREIEELRAAIHDRPDRLKLLPDVQIFHRAVQSALTRNEFFHEREIARARDLLRQGSKRAQELREGRAKWDTDTGLIVRGYVSRIDGSVQPYGLVVPASYTATAPHRFRLDVWCHGRGETLSELNFLHERHLAPGEFAPRDAFVLHPYGRYCNANKFAGEIDLFEALEDIKKHYPIDEDRLVMRGFSMGGAACWQFAVHYPTTWAAAAPGAGFSETEEFLRVFQNEALQPIDYQKRLLHLYDCTEYAANLFNCPTVAYSGEKDRQKQAADIMAKVLGAEGIDLVHIIGAGAGHRYTQEARDEINRRIDAIVEIGRDRVPPRLRFTTWTLRYNRCGWVEVDGLEEHWKRALIEAKREGGPGNAPVFATRNISAFSFDFPPGRCPLVVRPTPGAQIQVEIDGKPVGAPRPRSDRSWTAHFRKVGGEWQSVPSVEDGTLQKRHGLQGPIDDAFMDSFLMVRPTGKSRHERIGKWVDGELSHAIEHWKRQFRGEPRVKDDRDVTEADIAAHNLVIWGDPASNSLLGRIADRLPVKWSGEDVQLGSDRFEASHHVPVMIFPNPLNPGRYVVLNSGFTFREYDYLNNARQVPKLPDYAVIDIDTPVSPRSPGRVAAAGFFDERWELPAAGGSRN
ncbi:MAG: prolyl oligopeptidase family serine peptidase [Isosphaeraceae bacterium]